MDFCPPKVVVAGRGSGTAMTAAFPAAVVLPGILVRRSSLRTRVGTAYVHFETGVRPEDQRTASDARSRVAARGQI
jgi:hypothetical protein